MQVLVHVSTYQGSILAPVCEPQPNGGSARVSVGCPSLRTLQAISCGGMRGLGPELNVTDLSKRDTVERFGDPAWPTIMKAGKIGCPKF